MGIWLLVACVAYGFSLQFDRDVEFYRFGAAGWPRLIILLIFLAAAGQFVQDLRKSQDDANPWIAKRVWHASPAGHRPRRFMLRMGLTLALPLIYASLLQGMGFYFLTPLFLAGYLYLDRGAPGDPADRGTARESTPW